MIPISLQAFTVAVHKFLNAAPMGGWETSCLATVDAEFEPTTSVILLFPLVIYLDPEWTMYPDGQRAPQSYAQ